MSSPRRPCTRSSSRLQWVLLLIIGIIVVPERITALRAAARNNKESNEVYASNPTTTESETTTSTVAVLSNSHMIPLVGVGAGSIAHQKIPLIISSSLTSPVSMRLYDTSRSSSNEALVARALVRGMKLSAKNKNAPTVKDRVIHVITKVWYTHLGYERTNLSVRESLNNLSPILTSAPAGWSVKIHVLLQWPRCRDDLHETNCQEEEDALDDHTKSMGASPLLNKEGAWKESWKALEELYQAGILESIGISNFGYSDILELLDMCSVKPHIYQGNLWNLLFDKDLIELLDANGVLFQAYNVMSTTVTEDQKNDAPNAYKILERIAASYINPDGNGNANDMNAIESSNITSSSSSFTVPSLILAWLTQRGIGSLVGTTNQTHLIENSPSYISHFPSLLSRHDADIETALTAILKKSDLNRFHYSGDDPDKGVVVTFFNAFSKTVKVFLLPETGIQVPVSSYMDQGKSHRVVANPEDVFVVYDVYGTAVKKFRVMADHGGEETFSIEEQ